MEKQYDLFNKEINEEKWKLEWKDMPEFIQENKRPYQQIIINFRNEKEVKEFSNIIKQKITKNTHSVYFKKKDKELPSNFIYIHEENR